MLSAICFNLDQSKIVSSGNELNINHINKEIIIIMAICFCTINLNSFPDDKFIDRSKLNQIADDILKRIWNEIKVPYRLKNIVRKGEIACYKQFLLFSQCFP